MDDDCGGDRRTTEPAASDWTLLRHELRQPLQTLRLLHGALTRAVSDPAVLEMLEAQQEAIDALEERIAALPGGRSAATAAAGGPDPRPPTSAPPPGSCVLVVEDDPQLRKAWQRLLEAEGHRVACAASLAEVGAVLAQGAAPSLVIADYCLAGGLAGDAHGLHAIRTVRAATGVPTPALVITGDPGGIAGDPGLDGCRVIAKPVRPGTLLSLVREALGEAAPAAG